MILNIRVIKKSKWYYTILGEAFEALSKWYLNEWRDLNFYVFQPFRL